MFSTSKKEAVQYCKMHNITTKRKHKVVKCKQYKMPDDNGNDTIDGYTVILIPKGIQ